MSDGNQRACVCLYLNMRWTHSGTQPVLRQFDLETKIILQETFRELT
jgi:hypothetical protein